MTAIRRADLPVHAPSARNPDGMDSAFARRALGKREARRLASLMDDAEQRARAVLDAAAREVEVIFAAARDEARALLDALPDFAALEAAPAKHVGSGSAFRLVRLSADRRGIPIAAVTGKSCAPIAREARAEAAFALFSAGMSSAWIGTVLGGRSDDAARKLVSAGRKLAQARIDGDDGGVE